MRISRDILFHYGHCRHEPIVAAAAWLFGGTTAATVTLAGIGVAGGMMAAKAMTKGMPSISAPGAQQAKATAQALQQESEQEKQNRRLAAALVTRDFSIAPKLAKTGLLGW